MNKQELILLGKRVSEICEHISLPIMYIVENKHLIDINENDIKRMQYLCDIEENLTDSGNNLSWFMLIEKGAPFYGKTPRQYWIDNYKRPVVLLEIKLFTGNIYADKLLLMNKLAKIQLEKQKELDDANNRK